MGQAGLLAFVVAALVLAASVRVPTLLVGALLVIQAVAPYELYHIEWSIRVAFGSVDVVDLGMMWMIYVAAFRTLSRAHPPAVGRAVTIAAAACFAGIAYAIVGFIAGNEPNTVLNDARTFLMTPAAAWYLLTYPISRRGYVGLVWMALLGGFASLASNAEGFLTAAESGSRADPDLWVRPVLPAVLLLGWPLTDLIAAPTRRVRTLLSLAVVGGASILAALISQTRGYIAGLATVTACAVLFGNSLRRTTAMVLVLVAIAGIAVTAARDGGGPTAPLRTGAVAAAGRFEWDDSADSRRLELEALADQLSPMEWIFGRALGGTYDATLAHPGWAGALRHPYTHAGHGTFLLKFGGLGTAMLTWAALATLFRLLRHAQRKHADDAPAAAGIAAGLAAFMVTNSGDPICVAPLAMLELGVLFAAAAALVPVHARGPSDSTASDEALLQQGAA